MHDDVSAQTPKELLKQRLRENDPAYRYYKSIFNLTGGMIAVTDGDSIFDANTSFLNFFEPYLGASLEKCCFPSLLERVEKFGYVYDGYQNKRWFETVLEGEKEQYRIGVTKEGTLYTFNIILNLLDASDNIYIATLTDVTEMMGYKTVLEEGVRTSILDKEEAHSLLAQHNQAIDVSNMVARCDLNGNILYVNDSLCQALNYMPEELINQHVSVLFFSDSEIMCKKETWTGLENGEIKKDILKNKGKNGEAHYFDTTLFPLKNKQGKVIEILSIRHDITEMVKAKEEAIHTLESKTKFFDQISHELRTPLNAIINFTDQALENFEEMFEEEDTRDLVQMYLERAYKNSQSLLSLINSLLDMAKLNSGKETFAMEPYNAVRLVQETFDNCSSLNTNRSVEYRIKITIIDMWIDCDSLKFRQILVNLISNAFKFTQTGFIEVRLTEAGEECWIEVEDSGRGIPSQKLSTIFEPFEQARVHDQGTGLGLSIVRDYSQAMGFALDVRSVEGEGACFTLKAKKVEPKESRNG
ncbi:MAG: PAS domain-containing sensor histidine kinase [Sulfuricurvum sp.]|nr:PAS domain-containing sensor histidine kinase [Sulfuricurvum sp.]